MKWNVLACDYDGTLAHDGVLDADTASAIARFRNAGRQVLMVTGRELADLQNVCQVLDRFDWIVAENGALLYRPSDKFSELLCSPASAQLAQKLAEAGAQPLSIGRAIIATREPYETVVLEFIKKLGLELQVIFNKGAVMVLPSGVNKATGLGVALERMGVAPRDVVAIGDGENDHALLSAAGIGVAVSNAVPMLKEHADFVTQGARGAGV
ncbi:MAG: phosphoglycolate phosphatase, partial [Spartobacteria bacterium]|nr:phosphoglycolate phosphatase [Spartobacteria bacterium]